MKARTHISTVRFSGRGGWLYHTGGGRPDAYGSCRRMCRRGRMAPQQKTARAPRAPRALRQTAGAPQRERARRPRRMLAGWTSPAGHHRRQRRPAVAPGQMRHAWRQGTTPRSAPMGCANRGRTSDSGLQVATAAKRGGGGGGRGPGGRHGDRRRRRGRRATRRAPLAGLGLPVAASAARRRGGGSQGHGRGACMYHGM